MFAETSVEAVTEAVGSDLQRLAALIAGMVMVISTEEENEHKQ
jgi:hypothetical protein